MEIDVLKKLLELGRETRPDTLKPNEEPGHVYYLRDKDGNYELTEAEPKPRQHVAASLEAVLKMAESYPTTAEIWFSRHGLTLFLDGDTRRDVVTMPINLSPQVTRLTELAKNQPAFQQGAFIKELRIQFRGCLGQAGNLIDILRRVKFNATQSSDSEIGHGKASLGKQITAEVTGTGVLPAEFTMDVPVFDNPAFATVRRSVQVALEPDAATASFQLIPFPGQIEAAVAAGEAAILGMLAGGLNERALDKVGLFFGKA